MNFIKENIKGKETLTSITNLKWHSNLLDKFTTEQRIDKSSKFNGTNRHCDFFDPHIILVDLYYIAEK